MSEIPEDVLRRADEAHRHALHDRSLPSGSAARAFAAVITEHIRAEERAASDAAVDAAHEETFAAEDALEARAEELEQLRQDYNAIQRELADCDKRIAQAVAAERAAVVAFLRRLREHVYSGYLIAGRIKAGEHVK